METIFTAVKAAMEEERTFGRYAAGYVVNTGAAKAMGQQAAHCPRCGAPMNNSNYCTVCGLATKAMPPEVRGAMKGPSCPVCGAAMKGGPPPSPRALPHTRRNLGASHDHGGGPPTGVGGWGPGGSAGPFPRRVRAEERF